MKTLRPLLILLLLSTGCAMDSVLLLDDGNFASESRELPAFSRLDHGLAATVFLSQGPNREVVLQGGDKVLPHIETYVVGDVLMLSSNANIPPGSDPINIYITLPEVAGLKVSGSGSISNLTAIESGQIELIVSGSGDINLSGLFAPVVSAIVPGSGEIFFSRPDDELLRSQQVSHFIDISGSGRVAAFASTCHYARVDISGSGNAEVYTYDELEVGISGSGNLYYKGYPTISSSLTGSGRIFPVN